MAAKKKSSTKKNTKKVNKKEAANEQERMLYTDILILVVLALSILLFISNLGFGGFVGEAISDFFFGATGYMAYLIPLLLFFGTAFFISNRRNRLVYRKMIGAAGCYFFLCGFCQLLFADLAVRGELIEGYAWCALHKAGGGFLGALQVFLFGGAFGVIGAYVIVIIGFIVFLVIMTQRPILSSLRNGSAKKARSARESMKVRQQNRERQKEVRRQDKKEEKTRRKREPKAAVRKENVPADIVLEPSHAMAEVPSLDVPIMGISKADAEDIDTDEPAEDASLFATTVPDFLEQYTGKRKKAKAIVEEFAETEKPQDEEANLPEPVKKREVRRNPRSSREEITEGISEVQEVINQAEAASDESQYHFPPLDILEKSRGENGADQTAALKATALKLQQTLKNFGVNVTISNISCGPTVTRYELAPEQGVKVSKIVSLSDDIKLNLAAADIRIEAPIPGKAAVGIEVPNKTNQAVLLRDLLETKEFQEHPSRIAFAVGKDIAGQPVISDIARMPHLLIAGATGSGKSVCINTLIMSILYKAKPDEVKLIMIDPKVVELSVYNGIPHLYIPVVTEPKKAAGALNWAVAEMDERYNKFKEYGVRDLKGYNKKIAVLDDIEDENKPKRLPQIVIIVDELADLMMVAPGEVEDAICRLAQKARAAGIHLIIATQRPSVNVITGLIKVNMPSRIAFSVTAGVDSRTILDMNGAEKLLGKGDMLFYPQWFQKPARVQGSFVSDSEVSEVVEFLTRQAGEGGYDTELEEKIMKHTGAGGMGADASSERDVYFEQAGKFIIEKEKASIGMLQRMFKIGFNRAARIMDQLSDAGVVGPEEGTKPRKVLMTMEEFEQYIEEFL